MSLLAKIKADQLEARKAKAEARISLLTTLIGEASMIGKNDNNRETTDVEVIAVIKKFADKIDECLVLNLTEEKRAAYLAEKEVLSKYLPKQLDRLEMLSLIGALQVTTPAKLNLSQIMGHFKKTYPGQYNGTVLKEVAESFIKGS